MVSLLIIPLYMELWWLYLDSWHRRTLPTWINLRTCDLIAAILRTVTSLVILDFCFFYSQLFFISYTCWGHSVWKVSWLDTTEIKEKRTIHSHTNTPHAEGQQRIQPEPYKQKPVIKIRHERRTAIKKSLLIIIFIAEWWMISHVDGHLRNKQTFMMPSLTPDNKVSKESSVWLDFIFHHHKGIRFQW